MVGSRRSRLMAVPSGTCPPRAASAESPTLPTTTEPNVGPPAKPQGPKSRRWQASLCLMWVLGAFAIPQAGAAFVAVGYVDGQAVIRTSPDGLNWSRQDQSPAGQFGSVASDGNLWVAVGTVGAAAGLLYTSPDGFSWDLGAASPFGLFDVAHSAGLWVAVGEGTILTSTDATTWAPQGGVALVLHSVAANGTHWVAVGYEGAVLTSPDGSNWQAQASGTSANLLSVSWSGHEWLAVGTGGTVLRSIDGTLWNPVESGTTADLVAAAHDGSHWMAAGPDGTFVAQVSGQWVPGRLPYGLWSLIHCGIWIGAGGGTIATSLDGVAWTARSTLAGESLTALASDAPCPTKTSPAAMPDDPPPPPPAAAPSAPQEQALAPENVTEAIVQPALPENATLAELPQVDRIVGAVAPPARITPWPLAPVLWASGAGLAAGLLAARFLLPAGLFTRLRVNRLLEQPLRADIYALVKSEPGIHFREIARRVNRESGVVKHHLAALEAGNLLRGQRAPALGHRRFFAVDISDPRIIKAVSALWTPATRQVLECLLAHPGATLEGLAKATRLNYNVVQRHAHKLRDAGLAHARRHGRTLHLHPNTLAQRLLSQRESGTPQGPQRAVGPAAGRHAGGKVPA